MTGSRDELLVNDDDDSFIDTNHRKRRNSQIAGTVLYRFVVDGVAVPALVGKYIPNVLPQPAKELVNAGLIISSIAAGDVVDALTHREHPQSGVRKLSLIWVIAATLPPLATSVVLGYSIQYFGKIQGNSTDANFTDVSYSSTRPGPMGAEIIVTNLLVHNAVFELVYYAQFGLTKYLLENCCDGYPKLNEEVNEEGRNDDCGVVHVLQTTFKVATDVVRPIALYEALRMILMDVGREGVLHHHYFPLVVIGFDQLVKLSSHMVLVPEPLNNLVPKEQRRSPADYIDEVINSNGTFKTGPSNATVVKYASLYVLRATMGGLAFGWAALEGMNIMRGQSDQEKLESRDRMINLLAIAYATGVGEQVFDLGSFIWSKVSNCCSSMFSGRNVEYKELVTAADEDYDSTFKYS